MSFPIVRTLTLVGVVLGCSALPAAAEIGTPAGTVQQQAADALFEEYAPPPAQPGVVCVVDSGVDANSDTAPILAGSYALSPNTDTGDELSALNPPLTGGHSDGHGTYMAMIMAAPANGWGMVGIAPSSVRVYNVKALAAGQVTFAFPEYAAAISRCQALGSSMAVTVVNLSLGSGTQPSGSELEDLENYVQSANAHGLNVVAAVGNEGGPVQSPADVAGVLGVGASDANPANLAAMCAFSNRGPGVGVLAPGCDSQTQANGGGTGIEIAFSDDGSPAWTTGTSDSGAIVSAVLASMRAYAPSLTASQAQGCVRSTEVNGGNLDAAAAFRACGLGQIVNEGMAAYAAAQPPPPSTGGPSASRLILPNQANRSARPKPKIIRVRFHRPRLTITVAGIPRGLRLLLSVQRRNVKRQLVTVARRTSTHHTNTLQVAGWDRIIAQFLKGRTKLPATILTRKSTSKHVASRLRGRL